MARNQAKQDAQQLGAHGEDVTARWYERSGYEIVARNWRCFEGEIDIIARTGRTIVVCEVKTRRAGSLLHPLLAIGPAKQAKIRAAAFRWLAEHEHRGRVRFDVAAVVDDDVQVIESAF